MSPPSGDLNELGAWGPFLANYARALIDRRWQSRISGSDLAQKTLVDALSQKQKFEQLPPQARRAWLLEILRHNLLDVARAEMAKCRDARRQQSLEMTIDGSAARLGEMLSARPDETPEESESRERRMLALTAGLERLSEEQRMAITLRYFERLSVPEIASRMQLSPRAVTLVLARSVRQLKHWLTP